MPFTSAANLASFSVCNSCQSTRHCLCLLYYPAFGEQRREYQNFGFFIRPIPKLLNMKPKQKQGFFLLFIIAFEIFLFNNYLKYFIFKWICPGISGHIGANLIWIKIGLILIIGIWATFIYSKLKKRKNEPLFTVYLIKGFHVKGSDLIGVFNVLFVLCSAAWIGNEIYQQTSHGYLNALIYAGLLIVYPLVVVYYFLPKPQPRSIIIQKF